ncbi:outer membrane beta-barrel protein [Duganella sp. FT135W]|uniref:Outer membrane beta-barrel protein n=1 Tax=Duganella flavida TaxID=2692175 RepID=A0A6L8K6C9_9BURK|nr:outer membrane beta-barrel protein [Duganella flavida]MYM21432.1 outer membrane beta-barrel protein [Duganella flavida]
MLNKMKALCAMMIAAACGSVFGADQSPAYVGADVGTQFSNNSSLVRAYAGYNFGSNTLFGLPQTHALELMVFTLGTETKLVRMNDFGYYGGDAVRASGVGLNWTTALKLDDNWSLTSRLGANYARATTSFRYAAQSHPYDHPGLTAGVGVAYKLNPNVSLTVDVSYMPIKLNPYEKNTKPTLGTGLRYNF